MAAVRVREELDAPADVVWREIQDFGSTQAWYPAAKVLEVPGTGAGALRRVATQAGVSVERCESHDPVARSFSYALLDGPTPLRNYVATVRVEPLADDRSAITWSCTFDAASAELDGFCRYFEDRYRTRFIGSLRNHLREIRPK